MATGRASKGVDLMDLNGAMEDGSRVRNHIHATQAEKRRGGEEVAVVGVDFGETLFCGAGEVQGIGGAEKVGVGRVPKELFQTLLNGVGQWKPIKQAVIRVVNELFQNGEVGTLLEASLTIGAMERGDDFRPGVPSAGDGCVETRKLADHFKSMIPEARRAR